MFRYLLLALLIAGATSQHSAPCRCGAFISVNSTDVLLYELPEIDVHECVESLPCVSRCIVEFENMSGGGDLDYVTGETTVGQVLCDAAGGALDSKLVRGYAQLCDGEWELTNAESLQPLCCDDSATYVTC